MRTYAGSAVQNYGDQVLDELELTVSTALQRRRLTTACTRPRISGLLMQDLAVM